MKGTSFMRASAAGARAERGQAAIELVALAPLVAVTAVACLQGMAAGAAATLCDNAAGAAALAAADGRDPRGAALAALPGWSRSRVTVRLLSGGRTVAVTVRPRELLPGVGGMLERTATAGVPGPII